MHELGLNNRKVSTYTRNSADQPVSVVETPKLICCVHSKYLMSPWQLNSGCRVDLLYHTLPHYYVSRQQTVLQHHKSI